MTTESNKDIVQQLAQLAYALSAEKDHDRLLLQIVDGCISLSNADGGSLYTLSEEDPNELRFHVLHNRSLALHSKPGHLSSVLLRNSEGIESKLVAVQTFLQQKTINVPDAYSCRHYDFSGTLAFDQQLNYHSKSFLSVPLQDHEGEIIGVLQLINAQDDRGNIIAFSPEQESLIESLASMAATVLTKQKLMDAQRILFESFIQMIGRAIDHKSPVTGKHCEQVPEIAMMLAESVNSTQEGVYADIHWTDAQMYELKIAAWMHDCGKITTPEAIIDKATKLHTLVDRIELVEGRFRERKQQLEIERLRQQHSLSPAQAAEAQRIFEATCAQLDEDLAFLKNANKGGEFMIPAHQARVREIGLTEWTDINGESRVMLSDDEIKNLCIAKGTLTNEERQIMRDHIKVTIDMLESLPYPRPLSNVPEIACNHHECLNGSGYPRGLKADELSLRARIMCIADIFEALTSADRPYKQGMKLSQAMTIMGRMVLDEHLDADLFALFAHSGTYKTYAAKHMSERQIDEVNLDSLPGLKAYG
ncbi:MAG: HD domain-containing phosphohydrolase [Pontibacterium sp.]